MAARGGLRYAADVVGCLVGYVCQCVCDNWFQNVRMCVQEGGGVRRREGEREGERRREEERGGERGRSVDREGKGNQGKPHREKGGAVPAEDMLP